MEKKKIPVGYEDIKELIKGDFYFIDKTLMIRELLDNKGNVSLLTRPRRFGKTLNLSMLRRFFEDERNEKGEQIDNRFIFDGLAISQCEEKYLEHQQQYPVISLSLKSAKQPDYELAYNCLMGDIVREYQRHAYVLETDEITGAEQERFQAVMEYRADRSIYAKSLQFLSDCLARYHKKNVIILIDEYDVPLENAFFAGFYDQMVGFIRSLFESALKTNSSLEFAVVTGCLRISRESIFTGLNNLEIHSVLSPYYSSCFGFTEDEVKSLLEYYDLSDKYTELKKWYDGYQIGGQEIYNPWSIINYVKMAMADYDALPRPYWSNTSSNSIIRDLVENADHSTREEIERLMEGIVIEKPLHEDLTYGDIHESPDNLWNFLYFTGYLTECGQRGAGEEIYVKLRIPNSEVRSIYRRSILTWFEQKMKQMDRSPLIRALEEGDCETAEDFISGQLLDTISYFDYKESYYHGFLAGLLSGSDKYLIVSNRESGNGRPDLILKTAAIRKGRAMVLEVKMADSVADMEKRCREGREQICEQKYDAALRTEGYPRIDQFVVCFFRKECMLEKV